MKKLLCISLMSVFSGSMQGNVECETKQKIIKLTQEESVKNFIHKVSLGQVSEYNDICKSFNISSIKDLTDEQLKQIIRSSIDNNRTHLPYEGIRFSFCINYEAMENIIRFLTYIDQQCPLIMVINDLYFWVPLSQLYGSFKKNMLEERSGMVDIEMVDYYIKIIEGKKALDHSHEGILDRIVANPKNINILKNIKKTALKQYPELRE